MDQARIADLRRRLLADPTSIAFAQLAEEHRRAGQVDEAVAVCREGLSRHPGYLSARVTLGRALTELGQEPEAEREFEQVLSSAPDNLAAVRGLAEICHRQGRLEQALTHYRHALTLTRYDPELEETEQQIATALGSGSAPAADDDLSFEEASQELIDASSRIEVAAPNAPRVDFDALLRSLGQEPDAPAPPIVEAWLSGEPLAALPGGSESGGGEASLASDLFARIESGLRGIERRPPPSFQGAPGVPGMFRPPVDHMVIAELDRWLAAIARRRRVLAARPL